MKACCGADCDICQISKDCPGCFQIRGVPFWTAYVEIPVCPVYDCCVHDRNFPSCGECPNVPCKHYFAYPNPLMEEEEQKKELEIRMKNLKNDR